MPSVGDDGMEMVSNPMMMMENPMRSKSSEIKSFDASLDTPIQSADNSPSRTLLTATEEQSDDEKGNELQRSSNANRYT